MSDPHIFASCQDFINAAIGKSRCFDFLLLNSDCSKLQLCVILRAKGLLNF